MLTAAQKTTLKNTINADGTLNIYPNNEDGASAISALLDVVASPDFFVYRTAVPVQEIFDQISWSKMTPTDAVPTDTSLNAEIWTARSLSCQGKQFNLQTLLMGQPYINGTKANVRSGLQDALTNVPSGVAGATQGAGWNGIRDTVIARKATKAEKLFADTTAQNGSTAALAALLTFEGKLSAVDIVDARNNG